MMGTPDELAAQQIAGIATQVQGVPVTEQQLAAQAPAGIGVTEADIDALKASIAAVQRQLAEQAAASAAASPNDLTGSVDSLNLYLQSHNDPAAQALGADAAEAAKEIAASGDTGPLGQIAQRLIRHLENNPPYPGENYGYKGALTTAKHLPVVIDRVNEAQAPAKMVTGSVVG